MPTHARRRLRPPATPGRAPPPRPWTALPPHLQARLARQVARLLRRVREEARRADRAR